MEKVFKMVIIAIVLVVLTVALVLTGLLIKPNVEIKSNRAKLDVAPVSTADAGVDRIHFLSTDSSDAILIESDGHYALVDCAEDSDNPRGFEDLVYDGYEEVVLDYLKTNIADENGIVHLDFVLGTHSHSDHIGGFDTLINDENVVIDRAYLKEYDESKIDTHEVECWDNTEVYNQMLEALRIKNIPIISHVDEPQFKLGNFDIILFNTEYDNSGELVGENDNSFGVLVEKAGARVFLAGDIDNINGDEDRIGKQLGKIDLLKVGHHSYSRSTSAGWLYNLKPQYCVVTNAAEKVDKNTLRRICRVAHSAILITGAENGVIADIDDSGNIHFYNDIH